jgi:hypothetical protein
MLRVIRVQSPFWGGERFRHVGSPTCEPGYPPLLCVGRVSGVPRLVRTVKVADPEMHHPYRRRGGRVRQRTGQPRDIAHLIVSELSDDSPDVAALQPAKPAQAGDDRHSGRHQDSSDGIDADL